MAFEEYVYEGTQRLRRGYTTGTCAALAAKAATMMLLTGKAPDEVSLTTPAGIEVRVNPQMVESGEGWTSCAVVKDAGDDFDVTDKCLVKCTVSFGEDGQNGVNIDGGRGVGRVTQPGLDQPVGNAAINSGPRKMINAEVCGVLDELDCNRGISVLVEVPNGEKIAKKTFNSQLGVIGGISILGTSGIVEPQSLRALMDSLDVEVKARAATGSERLIVTPGNYGENFLSTYGLPDNIPVVKCANFIGHTLDCASVNGFKQILLVGHIGKLVKVAGAIMDTHSKIADCRREIFAAHAAYLGASREVIAQIFDAATTDACLDILKEVGLDKQVMDRISNAIQWQLDHRAAGEYEVGAVVFSNKRGQLAVTSGARKLIDEWGKVEQ